MRVEYKGKIVACPKCGSDVKDIFGAKYTPTEMKFERVEFECGSAYRTDSDGTPIVIIACPNG